MSSFTIIESDVEWIPKTSFFSWLGIIITTCGFIFTWTPYAVTLFISAFRGKDYAIPPMVTFFCACFAKSSVIWIPILYIGTSTQFKLHFVNRETLDLHFGSNRIDANFANIPALKRKSDDVHTLPGTPDQKPDKVEEHWSQVLLSFLCFYSVVFVHLVISDQ